MSRQTRQLGCGRMGLCYDLDTLRPALYTFRRTPTAELRTGIEDRGAIFTRSPLHPFTLSSCHLCGRSFVVGSRSSCKEGSPMSSVPLNQSASVGSSMEIELDRDKRGLLEFVEFPFQLYRGDPSWVPPLIEERRDFLDPKKN